MREVDVAVIGTGPAGQRAAVQASKLGASVVAIERRQVIGGSVINAGTIPSKTLREAVLYLTGFRERALYGAQYSVKAQISLQDLTFRLDHVLNLETEVMHDQLARNDVDVIYGVAKFIDSNRIEITGSETVVVKADRIILATGSIPARSDKVPMNGHSLVDTDTFFAIDQIPETMVVVGAGVIGVEYAGILGSLGVKVTLVDRRSDFLEFVDRGIIDALMAHMGENGVEFRLGDDVVSVTEDGRKVNTALASGEQIVSDCLLYTIGRSGATAELGLEVVGIEADERGRIKVNEDFQTAVKHIYAVGDVIGFPALAATSSEQGRVAARHALQAPAEPSPSVMPYGIYTVPEISLVGETEEALQARSAEYVVGTAKYQETARGHIIGDSYGRLKILVDPATHKILGTHIIGESAAELIHIAQAVMSLNGSYEYLVGAVFNYPTLAECYKVAALDVYNRLS